MALTEEHRAYLREVAWEAIREALDGRESTLDLPTTGPLGEPGSTFVTLRMGGKLRGCIGLIGGRYPLARCVWEAAVRVLEDPRFPPVTAAEIPDLELEISVLSPFTELESVEAVEVGKHGLFLRKGSHSGLLLPQVPKEQGWSQQQFLEAIGRKSGLSRNVYRDPETKLETFTAEVF